VKVASFCRLAASLDFLLPRSRVPARFSPAYGGGTGVFSVGAVGWSFSGSFSSVLARGAPIFPAHVDSGGHSAKHFPRGAGWRGGSALRVPSCSVAV
jgi:hypothetical protein